MGKIDVLEGEIVRMAGKEPEIGEAMRVVFSKGALNYKDEIVILGGGGFRGYPSAGLYTELSRRAEEGSKMQCIITEIKKEGVYNALFGPVIN